jgi:hypothetical protein
MSIEELRGNAFAERAEPLGTMSALRRCDAQDSLFVGVEGDTQIQWHWFLKTTACCTTSRVSEER